MALRHVQVTSVCRSVKKKGEDTHATLDADIGGELVYLSMVADGHGGAAAAEQCRSELLADIVAEAQDSAPDELTRAIHTCFVAIHERIRATTDSGAACTVVAIVASTGAVTCANSGDVLAVGFSPANSHPLHLAMSHRLEERGSRTTESDRVITAGGKIGRAKHPASGKPCGPLRAWPGGLSMGRVRPSQRSNSPRLGGAPSSLPTIPPPACSPAPILPSRALLPARTVTRRRRLR